MSKKYIKNVLLNLFIATIIGFCVFCTSLSLGHDLKIQYDNVMTYGTILKTLLASVIIGIMLYSFVFRD